MACLKHELWKNSDGLHMLCLAGPMGADARKTLSEGAQLIWSFEAESHFDAMTKYYAKLGRGEYTTDFAIDHELYPDEWQRIQRDS